MTPLQRKTDQEGSIQKTGKGQEEADWTKNVGTAEIELVKSITKGTIHGITTNNTWKTCTRCTTTKWCDCTTRWTLFNSLHLSRDSPLNILVSITPECLSNPQDQEIIDDLLWLFDLLNQLWMCQREILTRWTIASLGSSANQYPFVVKIQLGRSS